MTVGIVGLGLIGGSFAKAYKEAGWNVYVHDIDDAMLEFAKLKGVVDDPLDKDNIEQCDLILVCIYPNAAIEYIDEMGKYISKNTFVVDCCGTKEKICDVYFAEAAKYGFTYVGGHPMAGTQYSGFKFSKPDLFKGAYMVLVPPICDDMAFFDKLKELLSPAGFGHYSIISAQEHDKIIAFTSQLAHVVSNAYIKSPTARIHKGFSAGSYRDLTRVAWLNEDMWSELCMENRDNMISELDIIIKELCKYKAALESEDKAKLKSLFADGKKIKYEIDG